MGCCKMNSVCVCAKCYAALLSYFTVQKLEFSLEHEIRKLELEFSVLNHIFDSSTKDISYDEYFSFSKLSNCAVRKTFS